METKLDELSIDELKEIMTHEDRKEINALEDFRDHWNSGEYKNLEISIKKSSNDHKILLKLGNLKETEIHAIKVASCFSEIKIVKDVAVFVENTSGLKEYKTTSVEFLLKEIKKEEDENKDLFKEETLEISIDLPVGAKK
jgi:hypothetical protein